MPKTMGSGRAKREELPGTLQRSPAKAQRTFAKAHDSAAERYGEGERAHRVAFSAVKRGFEKRGDHWEAKDHKGPSDPRAKNPRARSAPRCRSAHPSTERHPRTLTAGAGS